MHLEHPVSVFLTQMRINCLINADRMQNEADGQQCEHLIILLVDLLIKQHHTNMFVYAYMKMLIKANLHWYSKIVSNQTKKYITIISDTTSALVQFAACFISVLILMTLPDFMLTISSYSNKLSD